MRRPALNRFDAIEKECNQQIAEALAAAFDNAEDLAQVRAIGRFATQWQLLDEHGIATNILGALDGRFFSDLREDGALFQKVREEAANYIDRSNIPVEFDEKSFKQHYGHAPVNDDLHRVNCRDAGETGHTTCGICAAHKLPVFMCETCFKAVANGDEIERI